MIAIKPLGPGEEWPPPLAIGDRVHHGVSSPDTGIIVKLGPKWAHVRWDKNGMHRELRSSLFSVTRSLTEWACYKRGERPCPSCGYSVYEKGATLCHVCRPIGEAKP